MQCYGYIGIIVPTMGIVGRIAPICAEEDIMKRSRKVEMLIATMNERSHEMLSADEEYEEGNSWLHYFLMETGNYRGFVYEVDEETGAVWCRTL